MISRYNLAENIHLRRALTVWAVFAVAVCAKTLLVGGEHSVYPVFAAASRHWWADMSLYSDYEQTEKIDGYRYSPTFAVAFTPLARLPDRLGAILWGLASIGMLFWSLRVLVRDVFLPFPLGEGRGEGGPSRESSTSDPNALTLSLSQRERGPARNLAQGERGPAEGAFLTLTLVGSAVGIWSGQSNAILPALVALALAAIVRQRWWTAAWLLAVPVFIKLWPLAIVLLLAACWPRQLIGRFAATCAALAAAPFLTRPFEKVVWQHHEWYASLTGPLQARWEGYRDAWTIWENVCPLAGRCADWQQPVNRHVYMALQLAAAAAVLGWCLWQRRRAERGDCPDFRARTRSVGPKMGLCPFLATGHLLTLIYSMWASWQLLFGPGTEQLTYGIIAPATSWAVLVSLAEKKARWLTVAAWAILALLAAGDIEKPILAVFPAGRILLPLGVVLFVAWLVWHECGERRGIRVQGSGLRIQGSDSDAQL